MFAKLCSGRWKIKKQFIPKVGEHYWVIGIIRDCDTWEYCEPRVVNLRWNGFELDYYDVYCGNCYRTKEEAEAHKYEFYERVTGEKWSDSND